MGNVIKKSFDVMREPWIKVRTVQGTYEVKSLIEVLEEAHNIIEVVDSNPQYVYGILNFFNAFLLSVYELEDCEAKVDLLEQGKFDITKIKGYIESCEEKRPNCFNLFGENPFYQSVTAKYDIKPNSEITKNDLGKVKQKEIAMIGKIVLEVPSGNNSIHFVSDSLVGKKIDYIEAAKALVSYSLFQAGQDGPNSAKGPNGGGNYPIYIVKEGNNLFDTLVFNMISRETWENRVGENVPYTGKAIWEIEPELVPKRVVHSVSLTEGLTFQNRFVLLGESDEDGLIDSVYFGPGRAFEDIPKSDSLWIQSNASYVKVIDKKTGEFTGASTFVRMKPDTEVWSTVGSLFNLDNNKLSIATIDEYKYIYDRYPEILEERGYNDKISYIIYYICVDGGKYPPIKMGYSKNYIPMMLLENGQYLANFNTLIQNVLNVGQELRRNLAEVLIHHGYKKFYKDLSVNKKILSLSRNLSSPYYDGVDNVLIPELLQKISDLSESEDIFEKFSDIISEFSLKVKELAVETMSNALLSSTTRGSWETGDGNQGFFGEYSKRMRIIRGICNKILGLEENKNKEEGGEDHG